MVSDTKMDPKGGAAKKCLLLEVGSVAASQAAVAVRKLLVPFKFEIEEVNAWESGGTGGAGTIDVRVAGTTVQAAGLVPGSGAGNPTKATLVATRPARRGAKGSRVTLHVTTGVGETFTNLTVAVWLRPFPLGQEA